MSSSTAGRGQRSSVVERVAALVAMLSLGAAIGVVVAGTAASWRGVILALVGLLIVVTASWYAVAHRGAVRGVGIAAAVVGAALLLAGVVVADVEGLAVVAVVALAALSVGAARVALHRTARAWRDGAELQGTAPPSRRPVLIMNLKSGGGKAAKFDLVEECRTRGIEPVVMQPGDDLTDLAEDAIARGADVIGMAGGDGSQALVATVAARHGVAHVVVPAGTRNHFALDLGLDRDDVVGALDAFADGVEHRVDLAVVNGRVFVNNATCGLYAKIVQSPDYRDAKGGTAANLLPDLLGPDAAPLDLRFTGPDGTAHASTHVILVSNNPYELHTVAGRGTRKRLDRGVLGVVAARIAGARDMRRLVALEATGRIHRFPGWLEWTAPQFRVDSAGPVEVGVDGEALRLDPPLVFESRPGALRIRLPRHAVGRSPAARAVHVMSRSTITELVRVVAGHPAAART